MTCDFKQCGILTIVDSDEPVQPPFKLRLRVCAGWSEPLLVAHTTLLEITCHGLNATQTCIDIGSQLNVYAESIILTNK